LEEAFLNNNIQPAFKNYIVEKGWKGFSEIQTLSFPVIYKGEDCIIEAPTSGGKTEAVLFPTLSRVAKNKESGIRILYLAPLKALLNNIDIRAKVYSELCGLHAFKWHGDVSQNKKTTEFNNPSQLLLTTPESLEAILLRKSNWAEIFKNLETIIIDETHNFASGDRGSHLLSLLERLEYSLEKLPQRIAVTATIGNPDEMLKWLAGKKRNPGKRVFAKSCKEKEKDFKIFFHDEKKDENAWEKLFHEMYGVLPNVKSLIFINSRSKSEIIAGKINEMNSESNTKNPIKIRTHHSSVSKFFREQAEFLISVKSESGLQAIINTSTLELGIDIGELDQVIQINSVTNSSSLLQRIGRTGRRENKPQIFKGFVSDKEDLLILIAVVNLAQRGISEKLFFTKKALHILAHQVICLSLQRHGVSSDLTWKILSNAYCFSEITRNDFDDLITFMVATKMLKYVGEELIIGENGEISFLGGNWRRLFAVFDSAPLYEVTNGKNQVGTLDSAFVESQKPPFVFMLGGMEWLAHEVKYVARQVVAQKTKSGIAPKWRTPGGTLVPLETAQEAAKILFSNEIPPYLDSTGRETLLSLKDEIKNVNWNPEEIIISKISSVEFNIYTFAGCKINRTLALILEIYEIGIGDSDYKLVNVKSFLEEQSLIGIQEDLCKNVCALLEKLKNFSESEILELHNRFESQMSEGAFSKFSKCLSTKLSQKVLSESSLDLKGVIELLNSSKVVVEQV